MDVVRHDDDFVVVGTGEPVGKGVSSAVNHLAHRRWLQQHQAALDADCDVIGARLAVIVAQPFSRIDRRWCLPGSQSVISGVLAVRPGRTVGANQRVCPTGGQTRRSAPTSPHVPASHRGRGEPTCSPNGQAAVPCMDHGPAHWMRTLTSRPRRSRSCSKKTSLFPRVRPRQRPLSFSSTSTSTSVPR